MFDVAVIGGGSDGYAAAIRVSQLGGRAVLIEKEKLGGICLNKGCIPTKALLESARIFFTIKRAAEFGIIVKEASIDFNAVMNRTNEVVERLVAGIRQLLDANNVRVVDGKASIMRQGIVEILKENGRKETVEARNVIVATGTDFHKIPIPGIAEDDIMTLDDILQLKEPPKRLLIIGGHPIWVELALIFSFLGTKVALIETESHILPLMDREIALRLQSILKRQGIDIFTNSKINRIETIPTGREAVIITQGKEQRLPVEAVISMDQMPDTGCLNLQGLSVMIRNGKILVNDKMETNVPTIYAVGDVTGSSLAYIALAEGIVAAENAMGFSSVMNYGTVPKCIFTIPEVSSVGLTEQEARERNIKVKIGRFPLGANGRALTLRDAEGLVKIVADEETGEILGIHMIGPRATDLIAIAVLGIKLEATIEDLAYTIQAHPTLSEAIKEAALDVKGKAIHKVSLH